MGRGSRKRAFSLRTQLFNKQLHDKFQRDYEEEPEMGDCGDGKRDNSALELLAGGAQRVTDWVLRRKREKHTKAGRVIPLGLDRLDPFFRTFAGENAELLDERSFICLTTSFGQKSKFLTKASHCSFKSLPQKDMQH